MKKSSSLVSVRTALLLLLPQAQLGAIRENSAQLWIEVSWGVPQAEAAVGSYSDKEIAKVESPQEKQIRVTREAELQELKKLLALRLPSQRRADLYLRQAELYFEAYRQEFILEGRVNEQKVARGTGARLLTGRSRGYLNRGIQAAEQILKLGIPTSNQDRLYFMLGYHLEEVGKRKESQRYYQRLVQEFPKSSFSGEAFRELGETAFEARDFSTAQQYFEKALPVLRSKAAQDPQAGLAVARVLHKLGWTQYRKKRTDQAIQNLQQSVTQAMTLGEGASGVKEEVLRDLALFMTEAGRVDDALVYFQKAAGGERAYPRLLEKLAKQYERQVEPIQAIRVYEAIIQASPQSEESIRARARLAELDLKQGDFHTAIAHVDPIRVPPELLSGEVESETSIAARNLKALIRKTATEQHQNARKMEEKQGEGKGREAFNRAERFYQLYLDRFLVSARSAKESQEIRMYLAEVKREQGKAREASELYEKMIRAGDSQLSREASTLWLRALAEGLKAEQKRSESNIKSTALKEGRPTAAEEEFISASEKVLKLLPESREAREGLLQKVQILADYRQTQDQALAGINDLLKRYPSSVEAHRAARLWIQILEDRLPSTASELEVSEEGEDLMEVMNRLRKIPELWSTDVAQKGVLKAKFGLLDEKFQLGRVARSEKESDFRAAAEGYERFARNQKVGSDEAAQAFSSAVASYLKAGDLSHAVAAYRFWHSSEETRKSKLSRELLIQHVEGLSLHAMVQGDASLASELSTEHWNRFGKGLVSEQALAAWASAFRLTCAARDEARSVSLFASMPLDRKLFDTLWTQYRRELLQTGDSTQNSYQQKLGAAIRKLPLSNEQKNLIDLWEKERTRPHHKTRELSPELARVSQELSERWKTATSRTPFRGKNLKEALDLRLTELDQAQKKLDSISLNSGDLAIQAARLRAERIRVLSQELLVASQRPDPSWGAATLASLNQIQQGLEGSIQQLLRKVLDSADANGWMSLELYPLRIEVAPYAPVLQLPSQSASQLKPEELRSRLKKDLKESMSWYELGLVHQAQGKASLAQWYLDRALALAPQVLRFDRAVTALELAQMRGVLAERGHLEAYVHLKSLPGAGQSSELALDLSILALRAGLVSAATQSFTRVSSETVANRWSDAVQLALDAAQGRSQSSISPRSDDVEPSWWWMNSAFVQVSDCAVLEKALQSGAGSGVFKRFVYAERLQERLRAQLKSAQSKGCGESK